MPADGRHLRKYVPPRELIERGPGRVAKPEVLEARPAGPLHLAAAGEYNRIAEKWEKLEEKLEELLANLKADSENLVNGGLREEVLMCHVDERALPLEWTPLQYAARHGSTDDVRRLLDIGADVSTRDVHGSTPLHNAARSGVEAVEKIRVLFEAGANLDAPDRYGMRPLHVAASCEKPKAARCASSHCACRWASISARSSSATGRSGDSNGNGSGRSRCHAPSRFVACTRTRLRTAARWSPDGGNDSTSGGGGGCGHASRAPVSRKSRRTSAFSWSAEPVL